jgi:hypothetical protein
MAVLEGKGREGKGWGDREREGKGGGDRERGGKEGTWSS